jgi:nitrogen fixation NifU-like protein
MSYTEKVMQHFKDPHNQGQIPDADAVGEVGNPLCGDMMKIYLKIKKSGDKPNLKKDEIEDIKFETLGCAAAIACSSILTDMAKGKNLEDAYAIEKKDIVSVLGELPAIKIHCSVLASDGLKVAVKNYLDQAGVINDYPEIKSFEVEEHLH